VTQHAGYNTQIKNLWSSVWKIREAFVINKRDLSFNQFLTYWIFQIYKTSQPSVRIWNPSSIKICQNLVLLKANKFDLAKNHRVAMTNVYTHGSKDFATPCSHWTNVKKLLLIARQLLYSFVTSGTVTQKQHWVPLFGREAENAFSLSSLFRQHGFSTEMTLTRIRSYVQKQIWAEKQPPTKWYKQRHHYVILFCIILSIEIWITLTLWHITTVLDVLCIWF
jgi:hypothetical protein